MAIITQAMSRPKLAFAYRPDHAGDVFAPSVLERLGRVCDVIDGNPMDRFDDARAARLLAEATILVTGWGCPVIDETVLAAAPHLRLIAHAAGSVKGFVTPAVFSAGIAVTNAADANAVPVAEFTLAAILFANKNVFGFRDDYRLGRDRTRVEQFTNAPVGNWQKTVGIVGLSRIGRRVVTLLRPFDLRVAVHDPYLAPDEAKALGVAALPLDAVMAQSDVVSLHAPALEATLHMIDAGRLALLRDGGTLINTARGALVDQAALTRELVSGRINAILDVTEPEVLAADDPLYDLPNVVLTPHIAGSIGRERERLGEMAVDEVTRFVRGEPMAHQIMAATMDRQA